MGSHVTGTMLQVESHRVNPLLFIIYVNDICDQINSTSQMFANNFSYYKYFKQLTHVAKYLYYILVASYIFNIPLETIVLIKSNMLALCCHNMPSHDAYHYSAGIII